MAAGRAKTGIVVGTMVKSNSFNILPIMDASTEVRSEPVAVPEHFLVFNLPVMAAASPVFPSLSWRRRPIRHRAGTMLAAACGIYPEALYLVGSVRPMLGRPTDRLPMPPASD